MTDWRDNIMASIRKPETLASKRRTNKFILQAHVPATFIHLFDRVTKEADYSQASWLRRAVAVQFSAQMGISLREILGTTTQVRGRGSRQPRFEDPGYDDLTDIGRFCPHPGCDGEHFLT